MLQKKLEGNGFSVWEKKTMKEILQEHKRNLNKSIREIDRERTNLQRDEKKTIMEMKKLAKEGQMVLGS